MNEADTIYTMYFSLGLSVNMGMVVPQWLLLGYRRMRERERDYLIAALIIEEERQARQQRRRRRAMWVKPCERFCFVCDKSLIIYSLYSPPTVTVRAPYGHPASAVVFVTNLRPPQGRPRATVRYHFKGRTAAAGFPA